MRYYNNSFLTPGTYYISLPFGVRTLQINCWGAGGCGGFARSTGIYTGGGGGGAFITWPGKDEFGDPLDVGGWPHLAAGNLIKIVVGAGGDSTNENSLNGENSVVYYSTDGFSWQEYCIANGGYGVGIDSTTGGVGGEASPEFPQNSFAGGAGAAGSESCNGETGGGGGSAGQEGAGGTAEGERGGEGGFNGGAEGAQGIPWSENPSGFIAGEDGGSPGAGGGGAMNYDDDKDSAVGGRGGDGKVQISYSFADNVLLCNVNSFNHN